MFFNLLYIPGILFYSICTGLNVVKSFSFKGSFDVSDGILLYANAFPFLNHKLNSTPFESRVFRSEEDCIAACTKTSRCRSLNFQFKAIPERNRNFVCHLLDTDKFNSSELFNASLDFHHYSLTVSAYRLISVSKMTILFSFYKNVVFPAQAEYS